MTTRRSSRRLSTASAKQQLDHLAAAAMDASADNILYRTPNATPDKEILQAHADKEKAEQDGQNQQLEKLVAKEGSAETEVESVVNAPSPPASPAPLHPPPPPPPTAAADVSANRKQLQQENPDLTVESVLANVATELEKAVEMKEEEQKMESNPSVSETHQVQQQQATQLENAPPSSSSNEVHISLDFPQHKTVSIEAAAAILSPPPIAYTANNSSGIYDPLAATNIQHQINPSTTLPQYHTAPAAIHHGLPHHNQQHNAHPHHHHLQQQQHIHRPPHHDIYNIDAASGFVDMSGIPMGARSNSYFDSPATSSTDRDSWLSNGSPFMDSPHNQNHHHYSPHHHHQHPHHPHRAMSLPHNQQQMSDMDILLAAPPTASFDQYNMPIPRHHPHASMSLVNEHQHHHHAPPPPQNHMQHFHPHPMARSDSVNSMHSLYDEHQQQQHHHHQQEQDHFMRAANSGTPIGSYDSPQMHPIHRHHPQHQYDQQMNGAFHEHHHNQHHHLDVGLSAPSPMHHQHVQQQHQLAYDQQQHHHHHQQQQHQHHVQRQFSLDSNTIQQQQQQQHQHQHPEMPLKPSNAVIGNPMTNAVAVDAGVHSSPFNQLSPPRVMSAPVFAGSSMDGSSVVANLAPHHQEQQHHQQQIMDYGLHSEHPPPPPHHHHHHQIHNPSTTYLMDPSGTVVLNIQHHSPSTAMNAHSSSSTTSTTSSSSSPANKENNGGNKGTKRVRPVYSDPSIDVDAAMQGVMIRSNLNAGHGVGIFEDESVAVASAAVNASASGFGGGGGGEDVFVRVYKCPKPLCSKTYKNANGLKYHMDKGQCELDSAQADMTSDETVIAVANAGPDIRVISKPYWCRIEGCGKRYKNLNGLKYHGRIMHPMYDFEKMVKGHLLSTGGTGIIELQPHEVDAINAGSSSSNIGGGGGGMGMPSSSSSNVLMGDEGVMTMDHHQQHHNHHYLHQDGEFNIQQQRHHQEEMYRDQMQQQHHQQEQIHHHHQQQQQLQHAFFNQQQQQHYHAGESSLPHLPSHHHLQQQAEHYPNHSSQLHQLEHQQQQQQQQQAVFHQRENHVHLDQQQQQLLNGTEHGSAIVMTTEPESIMVNNAIETSSTIVPPPLLSLAPISILETSTKCRSRKQDVGENIGVGVVVEEQVEEKEQVDKEIEKKEVEEEEEEEEEEYTEPEDERDEDYGRRRQRRTSATTATTTTRASRSKRR